MMLAITSRTYIIYVDEISSLCVCVSFIVNVSVNRYVNTDVLKERIKISGVIAQKVVEVLLVFQTELGS